MKVAEKASDRGAEMHIHVDGQVEALREYGQYISAEDKAICCYVPVDEGHRVKIRGKFSGTTLTIAYDAVIDGVFRKACSFIGKTLSNRKKNIELVEFLYRTEKGIIDTNMLVAPISGVTTSQNEKLETIGTVELRLYITRQLGVTHTIENVEKSFAPTGNIEDETEQTANYKQIVPTFQMTFEQDCAPLEKKKE